MARWLPRPNPSPRSSAMLASSALTRPASSVPPVIAAMTMGARRRFPRTATEVSTSSSLQSGNASWTSRTHSNRVDTPRKPTSSLAQIARWSLLRSPIPLMRFPKRSGRTVRTHLGRSPLSQLTQKRHDHLSQALGLFKWKAVTGVLDLFDSHAWVEVTQLRRDLEGDDGAVADDEQARDANRAHHVPILGVGRREHVEGAHAGFQSGLGLELDDLRRAMRVPRSGLRDEVRLL